MRRKMKIITYAFEVGSLVYAPTYTRPNINFAIGMLRRYQREQMGSLNCYKESLEISSRNQKLYAYMHTFG